MSQLKIAAVLLISIVLQLSLRAVWKPLAYIDFPLVVVVYIALQRDAWQALVVGTLAGLIVDAQMVKVLSPGAFRPKSSSTTSEVGSAVLTTSIW